MSGARPIGILDTGLNGRAADLPVIGTRESLIDLRGSDEKAQALTIFFSAPRPADGTTDFVAAGWPAVVVFLRWGAGGLSHEAEIDALRGGKLSLVANELQVDAALDGPVPGLGQITRFGAFAGLGSIAIPNQAQRTLSVGAVASGGVTAALRIPLFAQALRVFRAPQLALRVDFLDLAGGVLASEQVGLNVEFPQIPLVQDASHIVLTNLSGTTAMTHAHFIFPLALCVHKTFRGLAS